MSIEISDRAAQELLKLNVADGKFLRINVVQGGCAGMTYSAAIDDQFHDEDEVMFENPELKVFSDLGNAIFLEGLTVDYSDDLIKSGFRFVNANASGSCGCGASFAG
jgi:iron-sulfur cluster assembly protein